MKSKEKIELIVNSNDVDSATKTLLDICFNPNDWKWVQDICLSLITANKNEDVRRLAVTCLGHLARIHSTIEKEKVIPFLKKIKKGDINIAGTIDDALDDINMFAG
ncbi:MAG: hypothetical protein LBJ63_02555 [Prevotellaceae bacterium]|jgi:hypothetical protein|nr:hypothetical protein [Prevotellaceae bacterium]